MKAYQISHDDSINDGRCRVGAEDKLETSRGIPAQYIVTMTYKIKEIYCFDPLEKNLFSFSKRYERDMNKQTTPTFEQEVFQLKICCNDWFDLQQKKNRGD